MTAAARQMFGSIALALLAAVFLMLLADAARAHGNEVPLDAAGAVIAEQSETAVADLCCHVVPGCNAGLVPAAPQASAGTSFAVAHRPRGAGLHGSLALAQEPPPPRLQVCFS